MLSSLPFHLCDDIGLAGNINLPADVSGTVEIHHRWMIWQEKMKEGTEVFKNDWYKATEGFNVVEEFPHVVDLNELQFYKLFFDKEVKQLFLDCTNKYALTQKNDPSFTMKTEDLWNFFTIITFASYNLRPQFAMYWSNEVDISSPFVREIMSRNYFKKEKRIYISVTITS